MDLLGQRNEWLLVVDQATREITYCNKRTPDGGKDIDYCGICQHRLAIQPQLLEWNGTERYQVWEKEDAENHGCYHIISFPVEWKGHPSCVHIIVDVTAEKMNARHLNDDIYQDIETGIRNRLFLDECMEQALRERQDITLCYLDLEGVSEINVSLGREAGDAYIQNFVEIVRKNFRSGDTFARIKGDKFCLMLTGNVKHLIERKMDEILTIFQQDDNRVHSGHCNFQYGILNVEGESNTQTVDELLKEAEKIVKRKKRKNKSKDKTPTKRYDPFQFEEW